MSKQTVNERINIFLKSKRYSVNALSKELDVGQRTLNNQLAGVTSLGCGTVCAIAERFPELSAEWLLRGIGPMISDGVPHIYQVNDGGDAVWDFDSITLIINRAAKGMCLIASVLNIPYKPL